MNKFILTMSAALITAMAALPSSAGTQGNYPAYSGNKRMAIIMLAWKDKACPASRQNVVDRIWNNPQSLRKYYLDMSRNAMDFTLPSDAAADGTVPVTTSDVYGPYTLSIEAGFDKDIVYTNVESYYGSPGSSYLSGTHSVARDLAADRDGFRAQDYDYIMYVTPKGPSTGSVGGYAGVDSTYSHLYVLKQNYINHELGHNLGLAHSNTSVDQNGYGSQDCVMGNQNNPHLDSVHTYNMGWYPDANFSIQSYGQYIIENLAQPDTDNVKVLRFDRAAHGASGNPDYNIWVSYRVKGIGQDVGLNTSWDKKVNIHYCKAGSLRPTDGYNRYYYNNNVTKFLTGGSYTDPDSLCNVRFLREESSGNASAIIQLIDPNGNQPPSVPEQTVYVSPGTTDFSLQVDDPEDDPLSYDIVSAPAEGALSVSETTFTYSVTNVGSYSFTVRVNDGQYDSVDQVVFLEVVGMTPPTVNAGPDQVETIVENQPWTPVDIAITAWYDAADALTVTETNGSVSQWADKSGNGLTLTATTGSPETGTITINGLAAVDFTGDIMSTASNPFGIAVNNAFVLFVHRIDSIQNGTMFSLTGSSSSGSRWQAHLPWGDGTVYFDTGSSGGSGRISTNPGLAAGTVVMSGFYGSTADSLQEIYQNGTKLVGDTSGHSVSPVGNIMIGGIGGSCQDTSIGEVLVVNGAVALEDRQKLEGYLAHKWGLAASLPIDHPYKGVEPGGTMAVVNLNGVADDADGDPLNTSWTIESGPGPVTFINGTAPSATAYFTVAGVYVLRLTTTDGLSTVSDEVIITIKNAETLVTSNNTPYSWLKGFGITNNYDAADLADLDLDGALTWEEYLAGTDPTDPLSVFCIMQSPFQANGPELIWYGTMNSGVTTDFVIYRCTNLAENIWTQVGTQSRHVSGTNTWVDTGFSGQAYYRIGITP
jgi:hypothetical protein